MYEMFNVIIIMIIYITVFTLSACCSLSLSLSSLSGNLKKTVLLLGMLNLNFLSPFRETKKEERI